MNRYSQQLAAVPIAAAAAMAGAALSAEPENDEEQETPFEEARLFFELNHTDGDLGIHALVDGDEWKRLRIEDPNDVRMLDIFVKGRLRQQGLTEVFFESAEPTFDELAPRQFFRRFPEGVYDIQGTTLEGEELESEATISHVMPAPPGNVEISGIAAAENCDAQPLPSVAEPVIISWDPVTRSHPDLGKPGTVEILNYTLVLEREEPALLVFSVELPPDLTEFGIPSEFIGLGDEFKLEIQARATNGNQTVVESCFEIA